MPRAGVLRERRTIAPPSYLTKEADETSEELGSMRRSSRGKKSERALREESEIKALRCAAPSPCRAATLASAPMGLGVSSRRAVLRTESTCLSCARRDSGVELKPVYLCGICGLAKKVRGTRVQRPTCQLPLLLPSIPALSASPPVST